MKISFSLIAKIGLLLVVIGFFMPVACNQTGPEIAKTLMNLDKNFEGILMYVMLISAIIGVVLGCLAFTGKGFGGNVDWIIIIVCVLSGLIVYIGADNVKLQTGGYFILTGWIIAVAAKVLSTLKRES